MRLYGPLSATPKSTGWSAGVLQRQPPSVFWKANAFSIRNLRATEKPSLITHDGFGWPGLSLQHMPVQLDAIGLQTANGASTIISTSAVTSALCSAISLSISNTRLTLRKSWQALAEWICATHRSTPSASGRAWTHAVQRLAWDRPSPPRRWCARHRHCPACARGHRGRSNVKIRCGFPAKRGTFPLQLASFQKPPSGRCTTGSHWTRVRPRNSLVFPPAARRTLVERFAVRQSPPKKLSFRQTPASGAQKSSMNAASA
jgi:hypothetical protein